MASEVSRRTLLQAVGVTTATLAVPAIAATPADSVDKLIDDTTRQPRALRDGGQPFRGGNIDLPDNGVDYAQASAARSRDFAARARRLQAANADEAETLAMLAWDLERDVALAPFYFHYFPLGYLRPESDYLADQLSNIPTAEQRPEYLGWLNKAPRFVDNIRLRLLGQLERRLTVPRAEAIRAAVALRRDRAALMEAIATVAKGVPDDSSAAARAFGSDVERLARGPLATAFDQLIDTLEQRYTAGLTEESAMTRADDSRAYHAALLHLRTSDALDPVRTHEEARDSLAAIDAELARMRPALGGGGDAGVFHAHLNRDPRWHAQSADDLAARLNRGSAKIAPLLGALFNNLPKTPYGVGPVDPALTEVLLNGVYDGPSKANPRGTYLYNPTRLDVTNWIWATPLISHELMPGHHLHFARRFENTSLIPYRRSVVAAYSEGWGEYARRLMEDAGLYADDPWGLYASRLLDRRFALRTAVETGVHSRQWTWQEAETQLASDPLTRPGTSKQLALAAATFRTNGIVYWHGLRRFHELRDAAKRRSPGTFDLRAFHDTVMRGDFVAFALHRKRLGLPA